MSIYTLSVNYVAEKLLPPSLRKAIHLAWLRVILKPLQTFWDYVFDDFATGSTYSAYDVSLSYVRTNRVIHTNKSVYECILNASAGINPDNTTYWVKINDNFIGVDERILYNSQKIVFEYSLNKWFGAPSSSPQIYIVNNTVAGSSFLLGETSLFSSVLANDSIFSTTYLSDVYTPTAVYDYTIFVPVAVFNAQGTTTANRETAIRNFADKYNLIGMKYSVVTY